MPPKQKKDTLTKLKPMKTEGEAHVEEEKEKDTEAEVEKGYTKHSQWSTLSLNQFIARLPL